LQAPDRHIYLASRSLRRRELLRQIGIGFEVLLLREAPGRPADFDEHPGETESAEAYVERIARRKAEAGWARLSQRRLLRHPVLAADTTVALDGTILGKPADREEAVAFLQRLSGRTHAVHTAVAVHFEERLELAVSSSEVEFGALTEQEIRRYVATGEPLDKAGAYAIQGRAAVFVRQLRGSYSGVVGLPLFETSRLLASFGIRPFPARTHE
jgi:septum formation protein